MNTRKQLAVQIFFNPNMIAVKVFRHIQGKIHDRSRQILHRLSRTGRALHANGTTNDCMRMPSISGRTNQLHRLGSMTADLWFIGRHILELSNILGYLEITEL